MFVVKGCFQLYLDDERVQILGYEIEKEIVTQPLPCRMMRVGEGEADQVLVNPLVRSEVDVADSEIKAEDGEESVEETHGRDGGQEDEPEVEDDVDLFIDDVERQHTEGIRLLYGS